MSEIFDYCIVGSGPSGLTCSYELLKDNKKIKTFHFDGMWGIGTPEDLDYFNKFHGV